MPFAFSDGTCVFCHDGASNVVHPMADIFRHRRGSPGATGRSPCGFLWQMELSFRSGAHADDALMASLLTLSDVMGTGHHAAIIAEG